MYATGKRSINWVKRYIVNNPVELLSESIVERGTVYKQQVLKTDKEELAFLLVSPEGKIKEHRHDEDSEIYCDIEDDVTEMCPKGNTHFLENLSADKWLFVLSKKRF